MNYKKLRRSGRITKSVPVLLIGSDCEGRVFSEKTCTVVLSYHGAGVVSEHKLIAEQELILRSLETGREAEIRVVGEIGAQENRYTYGVAFVDDTMDFWELEFPPPPSLAERPLELLLECNACGATVTLLNGDYEFDVCAIHGGLVRYCTECGFATVWRRPELGAESATPRRKPPRQPRQPQPVKYAQTPPEKPAPLEPGVQYVSEVMAERDDWGVQALAEQVPVWTKRTMVTITPGGNKSPSGSEARTAIAVEERRNRVRAKVSYFACVKSGAFGEDVVACIDMSRGGLGFRTRNAYSISTEVTIAVPFSPESPQAPAIFVPARVVNIRELPESQMYRCGVMFLSRK